ncbi:hypothetical protein J6590_006588 [Homalodisca vitripennis]|nr:hypothetical protein J6590_006588 [Homalodisca vitripennis]
MCLNPRTKYMNVRQEAEIVSCLHWQAPKALNSAVDEFLAFDWETRKEETPKLNKGEIIMCEITRLRGNICTMQRCARRLSTASTRVRAERLSGSQYGNRSGAKTVGKVGKPQLKSAIRDLQTV